MATDQSSTQASVSDLAELCVLSFQEYLQQSVTIHPRELSLSEDQLARFSLWANSIGVFAPGRASMDHRLREAPEIIEIVTGLLDSLNDSIKNCSATLKSNYESQKEPSDRDEPTSTPSVDRSRQAIANEISLLYRLTNTIRRASKESQNQKAAKFFQIKDDEGNDAEGCLRMIFTNYVLGRFPDIEDTILQRLATTMVLRRKRILYRRSRYGANPIKPKRSALHPTVTLPTIEQPGNAPDVPLAVHDHVRTSKSGESTVESKAISATTLAADAFHKASAPSVISVTKTVALGNHEELVFPPAPTGRLKQKYKPLKRQRLENHRTYLQSLESSAQHVRVNTQWVEQVIQARFVDENKLENSLIRLFGPDNYRIQLKRGVFILSVPRLLTEEHIDSLYMDGGNASDEERSAVPSKTQDAVQNPTQHSGMNKPDQYPNLTISVPYDAEKMEQKLKMNLEKDWIYCCQLIGEITCPFCFYALPSLDVADDNKWRAHVKNDLDAYICLFEQCGHPDDLYNHSEGWLQHMREHALRWRCTSKSHGVLIFDIKAEYMDHMRNNHGSYTEAQLRVLADRKAQIVGPLFDSCPLCGTTEVHGPMEDHVVGHLRSLALKSLPPYEDEELDGSASERDSLATSQPQSRSTIKLDPERYVKPSFTDFGEQPRYMYNMNPFPSNAIDVTLGRKSLCPDIVSIPDDLADQNKIELVSSEDHSAIFIDSTMIESAPETNKRSWEWGAITESYRAANSPDTDPILRSIRRQNILKQGSVDPEETSRPAGSSRSYEPPKADLIADSIASADDLESLSRWNIPKSTSRGRRRGSPASTTSGASTGSPVLRYRRDEGGTERSSDPTEADPETLTFKHSSEAEPVSSDDRREPNKSSAYYSANSEAHGKELLRLKRPGMDSDALVVEYYSHSSGPGIESTPFVDGEYFRMLQQDEETSDTQPVQESGTSYSGIQKEAFSPNYFKTFFVEEKELGRGGMGVVLLVRHVLDGVNLGFFACKRILIGDDNAWLEKILVEVQLLSKLSHPNLVAYRHIWLEEFQIGRFAPSVPCVFILQQYCNAGDLKTYVLPSPKVPSTKEQLKEETRSRNSLQAETETKTEASFPLQRKLAFEEIYTIFKDIASGLAYLHGNGYIHRDLKPSNILLHQQDNEFRALISDFGEVRVDYQNSEAPYDYGMRPWDIYIAPELIKQDKDGQYGRYSTKSDVFCLGLILHFMCFGGLPFEGPGLKLGKEDTDPEMLREALVTWPGFQVTSNHRRERPDLPQQLHSLMSRLLALRPSDRPSAEEIEKTLRSEQNV